MSSMHNDRPTVNAPLHGWHPTLVRFLLGCPEIRAAFDDDQGDDEWAPHDAWTWELGPEPDPDDRRWWARQDDQGGMVEGESDRSDIAGFTDDAWTYRLEQMARAVEQQDRIDHGASPW